MANYVSTSLVITIRTLDDAASSVYTGSNRGLFVWGAQVELGTDFQTMRDDADNYRYYRTRGTTSSGFYVRIGRDYFPDQVLGGDTADRPFKNLRMLAHKGGVAQNLYINTNNSSRSNAPQTAEEVFVNYRADSPISKRWYQLAPYYASYAHVVDFPTDPTDHVRIGSKQTGKRTSNNLYENVAFYQIPATTRDTTAAADTNPAKFYNLGFHETRTIPRQPKYDAAMVVGIFDHYKLPRYISSSYTTISGNNTYYRPYNWFSFTPNTRWSRFAYGNGDRLGPIIRETFEFADTLSLTQTYKLPPDFFFPVERITFQPNITAKRGRYDDTYVKSGYSTSSVAAQVMEIFDNYKTISYWGKAWYALAPRYNSYTHTYKFPNDAEMVTSADAQARNIIQDYYAITSGATEDYQSASGSEDFQVIPV